MKNIYSLLIYLSCLTAGAQNPVEPCGTEYWRQQLLKEPGFFEKNEAFEQQVLQIFQQNNPGGARSGQVKTVPVVVHIIHNGGAENISDAEVQQAVSWLNQALANQGVFDQGSGADCGIQLCLAQRSPEGLPTNGITRNQSPLTEMQLETQDAALKNLNRWKPTDYINIWLVRNICSSNYGCGVYGYSNYPFAHGSNIDGIVMEAGYVTELTKITGLAHEMGHYFGLRHTFEGGCTNNDCLVDGDRICDTPPDQSTSGVPCGNPISTCSTDTQSGPFSSDQPDMTANFMDYGIIACFHDFTPDQTTRMNAALDDERKSLLESYGCLPPCPANALADFTASATSILPGQTVTFTNTSQNAVAYTWTVDGIAIGNQPNAMYTFQNPGTYIVSLNATPANQALCASSQKSLTIQVLCNTTASFTVSDLNPDVNQVIVLTNTSQNATQTEWFLDGVSQGNMLDTLSFPSEGYFTITLVSTNGACTQSAVIELSVNGICNDDNRLYQMTYTDEFGAWLAGKGLTVLEDGNLLYLFDHEGSGWEDLRLVKMTPGGQQLWAKSLRDSILQCATFGSIAATADGGFVLSFYKGFTDDGAHVAKFSGNGDLLWLRHIVGKFVLRDLTTSADGSITACGNTINNNFNEYWPAFIKFDANGTLQWFRVYQIQEAMVAISISSLADGGFIAAGQNSYMFRLSANGDMMWYRQNQGINLAEMIELESGELMGAGGNEPFFDGILIKLTADGAISFIKEYSSDTYSFYFTGIIRDHNKGFVLKTSAASNKLHLVGLDSLGNVKWTRKYPGLQHGDINSIQKFQDLGFVLTGTRSNFVPQSEAWIAKVDRKGRIGDCPVESPAIKSVDIITFSTSQSQVTEGPPLPVEAGALNILDWVVQPDTICAFSCTSAVEICANNKDDDDDGLIDCLDPDCPCTADKCAPKTGNIWYFGDKEGLDFNTDPPTILNDGKTVNTLASTVSDEQGKLLFYADGFYVYNRFNERMPNSFDKGNFAIPNPGDPSIYYLLRQNPSTNGYSYFTLDLKLDNGKGDIVPGNPVPLYLPQWGETYWPALTKTCDPDGYWLTSRALYTHTFWSFRIGANGIDPNPVISMVGQDTSIWSWIKFSPNGQRLAIGNRHKPGLEVFNFDAATGKVLDPEFYPLKTNKSILPSGIEFSPSGRFVYLSTFNLDNPLDSPLFQFDLAKPASPPFLVDVPDLPISDLKLASNGMIYGTVANSEFYHYLDVIENPNGKNETCDFHAQGLNFPSPFSANYLPYTVPTDHFLPSTYIYSATPDTICGYENLKYTYQLELPKCEVSSIEWSLEGIQGQISNLGSAVQIQYTEPGAGRLIATVQTSCGSASDTVPVFVAVPAATTIHLGPDRIVCQNGVFTFHAGSGFARYLWSDGTTDSTTTTLYPGTYWVQAWDFCGNFQTDSITVSIAPNSVLDLGPDLPQQCSGFTVGYQRPAAFESWHWTPETFINCADCADIQVSPENSITWVVYAQTQEGCISVDSLRATIRDTLLFSRDTFVCADQTLELYGAHLPADTSAQFLFPATGIGCDTLLTVHVLGLENSASELNVTICPNAIFEYQGISLSADTVALFYWPGALACDSLVRVTVNAYPPINLHLPMDTTIHIGASVLLEAETSGAAALNFVWSPSEGLSCIDCPDPLASPLDTITYSLAVTDANGCSSSEQVTIRVNEACRIRVPNAFTPNGDGSNDRFRPIMDPCVKTVRSWRILNRWGQMVFEQFNFAANDPNLGWDGSWNGKMQPSDVLIWQAEFEFFDGRRETQNGEVTLLR